MISYPRLDIQNLTLDKWPGGIDFNLVPLTQEAQIIPSWDVKKTLEILGLKEWIAEVHLDEFLIALDQSAMEVGERCLSWDFNLLVAALRLLQGIPIPLNL